MNISIATLFADFYKPFLNISLVRRAIENGNVSIDLKNLFDFVEPKKRIDSPTFGPGAGMLIRPDVIQKVVEAQEAKYGPAFKIFFSPQGKKLDQALLRKISQLTKVKEHVLLLPARYEGMDARVEECYSDCTISIGDFVLMGGDLPAMMFLEGFLRLIPGVVSKEESVMQESFSGPFIDYPEYTDPVKWCGYEVPEIIRSGNHEKIRIWRRNEAIKKSIFHHFKWVRTHIKNDIDIKEASEVIPPHYVVLMHSDVLLEGGRVGTSSVTSIDIHDIARSARTFGLRKFFIVTPLIDQQKIINKFLNFWINEKGISYNLSRYEAIKNVVLKYSIDEVIEQVKNETGKSPLLIATTARKEEGKTYIAYDEQEKIWSLQRPILIVLGTARGLAQTFFDKCDYILEPISGFSFFNHLSVRSAAAIIFDRWLGINPTYLIKEE